MVKWQYRTEVMDLHGQYRSKHDRLDNSDGQIDNTLNYEDQWEDINKLGEQGWELIGTTPYKDNVGDQYLIGFFKKQNNEVELKFGEITVRKGAKLNLDTNIKINSSR